MRSEERIEEAPVAFSSEKEKNKFYTDVKKYLPPSFVFYDTKWFQILI